MKIAAVRCWTYAAMLAAVLMYASSGCTASDKRMNQALEGLCFQHIGPQDKPMPEFCVSAPGAAAAIANTGADSDKIRTIELTPERWRALCELIDMNGKKVLGRPSILGDYQVRSSPSGSLLYLPPGGMRKVVSILESGDGLSAAQAEMLQRLRLRLSTSK